MYPVIVIFMEPRSKRFDFVELGVQNFTLLEALNHQVLKNIIFCLPLHTVKRDSSYLTT